MAINDNRDIRIQFLMSAGGHISHWHQHALVQVADLVFPGLSDIQQDEIVFAGLLQFGQFGSTNF